MDEAGRASPYSVDIGLENEGLAMAMHDAGIRRHTQEHSETARSEALAALPAGTLVAIFDNRNDASTAAVQLLTNDPGTCLWLRSGRDAGTSIRGARTRRSFLMKLLRGFGDEELQVREVLRQADDGRSVLVVRDRRPRSLKALSLASHIYQFGVWTSRPIA